MNNKSKVTLKVFDMVASKYPDTKIYIEEYVKEVCEGEGLTGKRLFISLVVFV